jgi:hypothetical protein
VKTPAERLPSAAEPAMSPAMRNLGIVLLAVSISGVVVHVAFYLLASPEMLLDFSRGTGLKVSAALGFANLFANIFHYHRTHMRLDVASRILAYLWIAAIILFLLYRKESLAA